MDEELRITIAGDWWQYYGMIISQFAPQWHGPALPRANGCLIHIGPDPHQRDKLSVSGDLGRTTIHVVVQQAERHATWQQLLGQLQMASQYTRAAYQQVYGSTPAQLIERYYGVRADGAKVTLKQLARQGGISYSAIIKAKALYDQAHMQQDGSSDESDDLFERRAHIGHHSARHY